MMRSRVLMGLCLTCRRVDFSGRVPRFLCGFKCAGAAFACRAYSREPGAD